MNKTFFCLCIVGVIVPTLLSGCQNIRDKLVEEKDILVEGVTELFENESKPKQQSGKDYRNTAWADEFVEKFQLRKSALKTKADKEFAKQHKHALREIAHHLQVGAVGLSDPNVSDMEKRMIDLSEKRPFLSVDCQIEFLTKMGDCAEFISSSDYIRPIK